MTENSEDIKVLIGQVAALEKAYEMQITMLMSLNTTITGLCEACRGRHDTINRDLFDIRGKVKVLTGLFIGGAGLATLAMLIAKALSK